MTRASATTSYLAGIGVSGTFLATTVVAFGLIFALVTFDAFPKLPGIGGGAEATSSIELTGARASSSQLAARTLAPATAEGAERQARLVVGGDGDGSTGGGFDGEGIPTTPGPGGSGGGGGSATVGGGGDGGSGSGGLGGLIDDTATGLNNTIDSTANGLNTTLNNTISGLNTTLNNTLSGLSGGG